MNLIRAHSKSDPKRLYGHGSLVKQACDLKPGHGVNIDAIFKAKSESASAAIQFLILRTLWVPAYRLIHSPLVYGLAKITKTGEVNVSFLSVHLRKPAV